MAREQGPGAALPRLPENMHVHKVATAESLIVELTSELAELERLGAFVAAAHLDACIHALSRDMRFRQDTSVPDLPARDVHAC